MGQSWSGTPPQQIGLTQGYDFTKDPAYQQAFNTLSQSPFMRQFDPMQYESYFQQGVANPALKTYEQQILPAIQSRNYSPSAVHGSSLNQALRSSAEDLSTGLGALRANYLQQGQQSHAQNQLQAIAQSLGLSSARASQTQPILQEAQTGWLQDLVKLLIAQGGQVASSAAKAGAFGGI